MFQPIHHHRCPLRASPWRFQPEIAMAITLRPPPNPEEERAPLASRQPWFSFAPTFICKRRGEKKRCKVPFAGPRKYKGGQSIHKLWGTCWGWQAHAMGQK